MLQHQALALPVGPKRAVLEPNEEVAVGAESWRAHRHVVSTELLTRAGGQVQVEDGRGPLLAVNAAKSIGRVLHPNKNEACEENEELRR